MKKHQRTSDPGSWVLPWWKLKPENRLDEGYMFELEWRYIEVLGIHPSGGAWKCLR